MPHALRDGRLQGLQGARRPQTTTPGATTAPSTSSTHEPPAPGDLATLGGWTAKPSYEALVELDEITRRLREECPWDREQNERTIVPHTVEEAYELADAANRGDDSKLIDELGDVLFQVYFLSLLLEERGAGDLGRGR